MADKSNQFIDTELERVFINTILNNPEVLDDVIEKITVSDFYAEIHRKIFDKIQKMYFETGEISRVKIFQYASKKFGKDRTKQLLETDYISPMETENIVEELNIYKFRRNVRKALKKAYEQLDSENINDIKSKIQDIVFEATSEDIGGDLIHDVEKVAVESLERFIDRQEGKAVERIRTGIKSLDSMLNGGFSKKHLSILAGRTSMGKTAMALTILNSILAIGDTPCLFVSLEQDRVKLLDRMLIQKSKVASDDFYNIKRDDDKPPVTEKQRNSIEWARNWVHDKPLKITDERGLTIKDIKSLVRKTNNLYDGKLGFIIIDYLTEIKTSPKGGRWDKGIADAIRELRNLAGELNCHILLIHQINRNFKNRKNKRPQLSDLRDTGEAEEKIDNGLLLHRPAYYKSRKEGEEEPLVQPGTELIIAKQREGKTGLIYFTWYSEIMYFQDIFDYKTNGEINYLKQGD